MASIIIGKQEEDALGATRRKSYQVKMTKFTSSQDLLERMSVLM